MSPAEARPDAAPRPPPWRIAGSRRVSLSDGRAVNLRPVAPRDADLMAEFFGALTEMETYYFFPLDEARARQLALDVESDPAYRLIAVGDAQDVDRVLGYMFLEWREAVPVYGACLRSGVQSAGLGRVMIDHFLASAAASGVGQVRLTVHTDNWRALRIYQRSGFRLTGEVVNEHQGVPQYRMEVDLSRPRQPIDEDVTVIPLGPVGVATVAARVQDALEAVRGTRPFLLDRPARADGKAVLVADLGRVTSPWSALTGPSASEGGQADGWIVALDERHELVAGIGVAALEAAVRRYVAGLSLR
jgi:ribosomal protein S18 acetylase RimI-like enzyme